MPPVTIDSKREPILSETFEVLPNPSLDEVIRVMAKAANFFNLYAAEALRSRLVTASNPAPMAILNAAANLEQGAIAQRQQQAMQAQGQGFAAPPPGMPPGGFRMN